MDKIYYIGEQHSIYIINKICVMFYIELTLSYKVNIIYAREISGQDWRERRIHARAYAYSCP